MKKVISGSLIFVSANLFSLPTCPTIIEGKASVHFDHNLAEIQTGDYACIHWDDFSISKEETVHFIQPNVAAVAINRVFSSNVSSIFGKLESIGQILIINPNGILFGNEAQINTGSLLASTLDLIDQTSNKLIFSKSKDSSIIHLGNIQTKGSVIFLSDVIENRGSITSDMSVLFGSGQKGTCTLIERPTISFDIPTSGSITNLSKIETSFCQFLCHSDKEIGIQNFGEIFARERIDLDAPYSIIEQRGQLTSMHDNFGGEIRILGKSNHLYPNSITDVSAPFGNGTILIGGDYKGQNPEIFNSDDVWVGMDAQILASATEDGIGGKIIFWGNQSNIFRGVVKADGGKISGDGGFIEISSKGYLDPMGTISAKAYHGKAGQVLFDPCAVTISTAMDAGLATGPPTYTFSLAAANIDVATLIGALIGASVTIDASASGPGAPGTGSITVNASMPPDTPAGVPITWAAPNSLTLIADGTITIRNRINATNGATPSTTPLIEVIAPTVIIGDPTTPLPDVATLSTSSGQISVTASSSLSVYGNAVGIAYPPVTPMIGGILSGGSVVINAGNLLLTTINPSAGIGNHIRATDDVTVNATGNIDLIASSGQTSIATSAGGTVNVTCGGNLTLQGGDLGASLCQSTIFGDAGGDLFVNVTGDIGMFGGAASGGGADGSAGITIQTSPGSVNVQARNLTMIGSSNPTGTNISLIGVILGGSGPTTINLTGNLNATAQADQSVIIGSFFGMPVPSGDLFLTAANATLTASSTATIPTNGATLIGVNGNANVNIPGTFTAVAGGGTTFAAAAVITFPPGASVNYSGGNVQFFGGSGTSCLAGIFSQNGPTTVNLTGNCFMQGGSGPVASAFIGAANAGSTGDLNFTAANLTAIGGSGAGADSGLLTGEGSITATLNGSSGVSLTGGAGGLGAMKTFGTLSTNFITLTALNPSANLNLTSGSGAAAEITTFGGEINIEIGNDITLTSNGAVLANISMGGLGTSDLTVQAGHSLSIDSTIENLGTGEIFLVVDAAFPTPPFFGTSSIFHLGATATITTTFGAIRIFTSQQNLNSILGTINGLTFTPGVPFVDTLQEIWGVYYPSTLEGIPFTIFYKNTQQELASQASIVIDESLVDLHPYNEFPGSWELFHLACNLEDVKYDEPYFITRRNLNVFWAPKNYTIWLHDIIEDKSLLLEEAED